MPRGGRGDKSLHWVVYLLRIASTRVIQSVRVPLTLFFKPDDHVWPTLAARCGWLVWQFVNKLFVLYHLCFVHETNTAQNIALWISTALTHSVQHQVTGVFHMKRTASCLPLAGSLEKTCFGIYDGSLPFRKWIATRYTPRTYKRASPQQHVDDQHYAPSSSP